MGELLEQLKSHLENTPKEQLEREIFEIQCKMYDINSNLPNAKRKLAWRKFQYKYLNKISYYIDIICMILWFMCAGANIILSRPWWAIVICMVFGFGFLYNMIYKIRKFNF